jgi:hypothetical protein
MDLVAPFSAYFPYIHPKDADSLSLTCKVYRIMVDDEYKRTGRKAVLPGGCWHHRLCKRARDSVHQSNENYKPKAVASLVDSTCIVCSRSLMASVTTWGFAAHPTCLRDMLVNTYYVEEKWGLQWHDINKMIPRQRLTGYRRISRESYEYDVVIRHTYGRLVPMQWTLKHLVLKLCASKVQAFVSRKRKERSELLQKAEAKRQKQELLDKKRADAMAIRVLAVANHPQGSMVRGVFHVKGRYVFGDYFKDILRPKTTLEEVVFEAQKYDVRVLARQEVTYYLSNLINSVEDSQKKQMVRQARLESRMNTRKDTGIRCILCRSNLRAKDCAFEKCGTCCSKTGCRRHS